MCDRPNVEVTNSPIAEFTENGIITEDGSVREVDIVAVCTGYDAVTGGLRTMGITGRDGIDLGEKWKDGVRTHLGMLVHGYPNMLIAYGPQGEQCMNFPTEFN
jgi:cation diffusion facilitator CzcD-associated flavoprotein CzcO